MNDDRGTADLGLLVNLLFVTLAPVAIFSERVQHDVGEIGVYLGAIVAAVSCYRIVNRFFRRIDRIEDGQRIIMRHLGIEHPDEAGE